MIARPYLIGLITIAVLAIAIGVLATVVTPNQETVVDVLDPPVGMQ